MALPHKRCLYSPSEQTRLQLNSIFRFWVLLFCRLTAFGVEHFRYCFLFTFDSIVWITEGPCDTAYIWKCLDNFIRFYLFRATGVLLLCWRFFCENTLTCCCAVFCIPFELETGLGLECVWTDVLYAPWKLLSKFLFPTWPRYPGKCLEFSMSACFVLLDKCCVMFSSMATCPNSKTWCRIIYVRPPTSEQCLTMQQIFKTRFCLTLFFGPLLQFTFTICMDIIHFDTSCTG